MLFSPLSRYISWILPLVLLDVTLRGISLWKAAQAKQKIWFIALLLVNSLGILPAIYLLTHRKN